MLTVIAVIQNSESSSSIRLVYYFIRSRAELYSEMLFCASVILSSKSLNFSSINLDSFLTYPTKGG
jgi:hypothetical protein